MLENRVLKKLITFGILIEIIYLLFFFIEPLRKHWGDSSLTASNGNIFFLVTASLLIILAIYIFAYRQVNKDSNSLKIVIIFSILFNLTLLFVWPIGSTDLFSDIGRSRVLSEHRVNPYLFPYNSFTEDVFYEQINNIWLLKPTPYGPLWTIMGSALTFVAGNSLLLNLFLFKLFFVIINIANIYILHKTFKNNKITFLYGWNPLILFEFINNGHNDILTIFFVFLSIFFLLKPQNKLKNYIWSWLFLLFSVLIKYMTLIFLPIFFLIILFNIKQKKQKIFFSVSSILISIMTAFIFFWPFLGETNTFSTLIFYLSSPLQATKMAGLSIYPPILTIFISHLLSFFKVFNYYSWSVFISKIIFIIFYCLMLFYLFIKRNQLQRKDIIKYSCLSLAIFLFTFFSWVFPWYYILLIVLLIYCSAVQKYKYNIYIYGLTLFGILYYLILR